MPRRALQRRCWMSICKDKKGGRLGTRRKVTWTPMKILGGEEGTMNKDEFAEFLNHYQCLPTCRMKIMMMMMMTRRWRRKKKKRKRKRKLSSKRRRKKPPS